MKAILGFLFKPVVLLFVLVLALGGATTYMYDQWNKAREEVAALKENPNSAAEKEVESLIKEVGKLMELPSEEKPTVATVTDAEKLKKDSPQFFAKAENGDKILIYTQARKAILYRPGTKKVLDVAPVNIGNQATFVAKFGVLNGSTKTSAVGDFEKELKSKLPAVEVSKKGNAAANNYPTSMVIAIKEEQKKNLAAVAETLKIKTAEKMPDGEVVPEGVDFVIILGADR